MTVIPIISQSSDVDFTAMADALADLGKLPDFAAAQRHLKHFAEAIDMPLLAWAPDVARPDFDQQMDDFFRREGWPDAVLALWWNRTVMLKSPLYIRCRTHGLPFVSSPAENLPARPVELRQVGNAMREMGVETLITVPIHLPRGLVAMVTWGGARSKSDALAILPSIRPSLISAAHLFMQSYLVHSLPLVTSEEEIARLTLREWECLRLTAQGVREEKVAELLGLGSTTVRYHLDNVVRKLGAVNRTHAVALAAQLGLLGPIG